MESRFSFICTDCGERHEGSPSLSFSAPFYWDEENAAADPDGSQLSTDFCSIGNRDFFIRCVLEIPIIGADEPFTWGIWISQSKTNFEKYVETFHSSPSMITFGYFANRLLFYADTLNLQAQVH
jgi:hypothetical protein